jgi:hypothetical protein
MAARSDNPGVWFPPPLWYALAVLIGVLIDRRWPLPIVADPLITIAGVLVIAWLALTFASIGRFSPLQNDHRPHSPGGRARAIWPVPLHAEPNVCKSGAPHDRMRAAPGNVVADRPTLPAKIAATLHGPAISVQGGEVSGS